MRVKPMDYYLIFLGLRGRRCVLIGAGRVAERKVHTLLRLGARVRIISPDLSPRLPQLTSKNRISVTSRLAEGDLNGAVLVFAAADHPATQQAVREEGEAVGTLIKVVDDREQSSSPVPASFAQGDLLVALSTSGASPALARRLRNELRETLGYEYRAYLKFMHKTRKQVMALIPTSEKGAWVFRELAAKLSADCFAEPRRAADEVKKVLRSLGPRREGIEAGGRNQVSEVSEPRAKRL